MCSSETRCMPCYLYGSGCRARGSRDEAELRPQADGVSICATLRCAALPAWPGLQEGLAHLCLVGSTCTLTRAKVEANVPRKRGAAAAGYDKAMDSFYDKVGRGEGGRGGEGRWRGGEAWGGRGGEGRC